MCSSIYKHIGCPTTPDRKRHDVCTVASPDSHDLTKAQGDCKRLEQEVLELRRDLETSLKEAKQSAEQANMANFQNQLLIDMVRAALQQQTNENHNCTLVHYFVATWTAVLLFQSVCFLYNRISTRCLAAVISSLRFIR